MEQPSTGAEGGDFLSHLDHLDPQARALVLQQLLQEYDRVPAGTFPFPREVISEYVMRGGTNNNRFDMPSPIKKVVQSPNESTQ